MGRRLEREGGQPPAREQQETESEEKSEEDFLAVDPSQPRTPSSPLHSAFFCDHKIEASIVVVFSV